MVPLRKKYTLYFIMVPLRKKYKLSFHNGSFKKVLKYGTPKPSVFGHQQEVHSSGRALEAKAAANELLSKERGSFGGV